MDRDTPRPHHLRAVPDPPAVDPSAVEAAMLEAARRQALATAIARVWPGRERDAHLIRVLAASRLSETDLIELHAQLLTAQG